MKTLSRATAVFILALPLAATAQQACVRAAHLSPYVGSVDIRVDGDVVFGNVAFPNYTDYVNLSPGGYLVEITPAGDPNTVLTDMAIRVRANRSYTYGAVGESVDMDILRFDDLTQPLPPGYGGTRIINVSPNAPVVDMVAPDGRVLLDNFMGGTASEYVVLPEGTYPALAQDQQGNVLQNENFIVAAGEITSTLGAGLYQGDPPLRPVVAVDFPNPCSFEYQTVDQSGMWFDPTQNGQGVQLVQTGNTLEGAWYVYDSLSMATFYTFSGAMDSDGNFSGDLLAWVGPALGADPWDESQLNFATAGSVNIIFNPTVKQALLSWQVSSTSGTLTLVPYKIPSAF